MESILQANQSRLAALQEQFKAVRPTRGHDDFAAFDTKNPSVVPGPGDMTPRNPKRNKPPGAAFSDVEVREALRSILARQDMMEARQVEMMNQLEVLGRQASVQQQALMDTLEAAKSALVAVERYDRTPSFVISASIHVWNAMPVRSI